MELIKDTINICNVSAKGMTQAMADGDVIVPDIKPDILKPIQVDSDACITDKYIENGRLIICGRVDYKILYVPDSENEKIKSILTSMEFRQAVDSGNADGDATIFTKPTVEKVEFNMVNSRKMRLRAIIHIEYEICKIGIVEICTDVENDEIEKRCNDITFENTTDISEHCFTVKETTEIPSGTASVGEVLKADVKIFDTEYKAVSGKVIVKGSVGACILYNDDEGEIKFVETELPFTEVLDADGVSESSVCDVDYCVLSVMCGVEPDNDGDLRQLNIDVDICASLKCTEPYNGKILDDCFVPYMDTVCEKDEFTLTITKERPSTQNTIREIIPIPQNAPSISGVYNVMTNAQITKSELQRNKVICEGKIEAYILYLTDSTENPIYSLKKEIPFSYMIECDNSTDNLECEVKVDVRYVSYSLNAGGEVELRCLISVECMLLEKKKICNICDISVTEKGYNGGIVIYFAQAGENVWDIAKRYSVPVERLNAYNDLTEDKVRESVKLFIPDR